MIPELIKARNFIKMCLDEMELGRAVPYEESEG